MTGIDHTKEGTYIITHPINFKSHISNLVVGRRQPPTWKDTLPTAAQLLCKGFSKPDIRRSFTQEACGETILFSVLKSGYLDHDDLVNLYQTNPLIPHMARMMDALQDYDFRWIQNIDKEWASRTSIRPNKVKAMLACLMHYNLDVSLLLRYLGHNYTGEHRDTKETVSILRSYNIEEDLINRFSDLMTQGCPSKLNAETTRENAFHYWQQGNNPSIKRHLLSVMKTMSKEERNNFVIPLPGWLWRYIQHLSYIPQHLLVIAGKKDRMISDCSHQHHADSIPINMMTSTAEGVELPCGFGTVKLRLLQRIWNLRISHPNLDIITHANDIRSCFRQMKNNADVMGAFSYIIDKVLFLQCGLCFGADFSPACWEVCRRIIEILAEKLFDDETLPTKHRQYLDRLQWQRSLGSSKASFTPAKADNINKGVLDENGNAANTPHALYVDDDVYAEIFDKDRVERAIAATIEAAFILLGYSDLTKRQDCISFDKLEETSIDYTNKLLGTIIHTRKLAVSTPIEYIDETRNILTKTWHKARVSFTLSEIETLTGRLGHISETLPWLRYLMAQLYLSITASLGESTEILLTKGQFRQLLKQAKKQLATQPIDGSDEAAAQHERAVRHKRFAQSRTSKMIHHTKHKFKINYTLRCEIRLIRSALCSDWIDLWRPIGHMIPREPSGTGWSDSCLRAAGGFSKDMMFWWYLEWPEEIRRRTLLHIKNNDDGKLISINVLEYAALIINYVASCYYFIHHSPSTADPYPVVLLYADNTTAESWMQKACTKSFLGRALGRLQCALLINNPVGINIDHVTTKDNEIADRISRIKAETNTLVDMHKIFQDYPELRCLPRFQPSQELISLIMDTLLTNKYVDPLTVSRRVLADPGRLIM